MDITKEELFEICKKAALEANQEQIEIKINRRIKEESPEECYNNLTLTKPQADSILSDDFGEKRTKISSDINSSIPTNKENIYTPIIPGDPKTDPIDQRKDSDESLIEFPCIHRRHLAVLSLLVVPISLLAFGKLFLSRTGS